MNGKSLDIAKDKIEQLKAILPEAVTEGKIDWEKLRLTLGDDVNVSDERYVLNWAGKSDSFRVLQNPTTATLAPVEKESVNFNETENIFIEGENLETLKVLQKAYYGKVKMIYIDPPYNTGNDSFVYPDRFAESREEYLKRINDKDEDGMMMREGVFRKNSKDGGHYHSNWLSMMYPRLFLARNLLREDGVIFVSIDDNEVHNLRILLNEIFGEENFLASICWERADSPRMDAHYFSTKHDYILCVAKNIESFQILRKPYEGEEIPDHYNKTDEKGRKYYLKPLRAMGSQEDTREARPSLYYEITAPDGTSVFPKLQGGGDGRWRWSRTKLERERSRIEWVNKKEEWTPYYRIYADEVSTKPPETMLFSKDVGSTRTATAELKALFEEVKFFDTPKPVNLIKHLLQISTEDSDTVLDFFAGSGSTAHAVIEQNIEDEGSRQFILVQLPELVPSGDYSDIAEFCKERIRRVITKVKKENPMFAENGQDLGFKVFKLKHSNFKLWRGDGIENGEELEKQLDMLADPVRPEALEEHMLFELLLKSGYPLTTQVEKRKISKAYYYLIDGELAIALSHLSEDIVRNILEAAPQQVICLDSLFADDDPLKTNTQLQFKDAGIKFHSI